MKQRAFTVLSVLALGGAVATTAIACGFGVDLDNLFAEENGSPDATPIDGLDGSIDSGATPTDGSSDSGVPKAKIVQVSAGTSFECARRVDGTVMCWGRGTDGRLGDGNSNLSTSVPVLVRDLPDAIDLSLGSGHACVVRQAGSVYCWGFNANGQVGNGTTSEARTPQPVTQVTDATQVSAGGFFSCALRKDKTVMCWGDNAAGQLGDTTLTVRSQPVAVQGLADVTQLASSIATTCALVSSGEVYCWGENGNGQVGTGTAGTDVPTATKVPGLTGVASLGAGSTGDHICAVLTSGEARCWGYGESGCLGNAKVVDSAVPVAPVGLTDAARISTGNGYTCASRKGGELTCWGTNLWETLALGDTPGPPPGGVSSPVPATGITGVELLATGNTTTCAVTKSGESLLCWGANQYGSLGRNTRLYADTPVKSALASTSAPNILGFGREHGCSVDATQKALSCWGMNNSRQQATTDFMTIGTPTLVTAIDDVTKVAGGDDHTCVVIGDGGVRCWGRGEDGSFGAGSSPFTQSTPSIYLAGSATSVSAGFHFTCAVHATKQVTCSGRNDDGRLGHGGGWTTTPSAVLTQFSDGGVGPPLTNVDKIATARYHTCTIHGTRLSCWGSNDRGQLGFTGGARSAPFEVILSPSATEVAVGARHTCARLTDGSARCWGNNASGQLTGGEPSGATLRTPDFGVGKTITALAAGDEHTCALTTDKTVLCWGNNLLGQLGNGTRVDSSVPVPVTGLANVDAIASRENRTCAVTAGTLYCWGSNTVGQLADGVVMTTGEPKPIEGY